MSVYLSKSRYLSGLQCPKLLWTWFHERDRIPEPGPTQRRIFKVGHRVGDLAKQLFPGGIEVPMGERVETILATGKLIERTARQRVPVFEASFMFDWRYCRVDVLDPRPDGSWDLIEVKSTARVKDIHVQDVAFQHGCLVRLGLKIHRIYVMHIDSSYVLGDQFDVEKFFNKEDVTERVLALTGYTQKALEKMLAVLGGPDPDTPIGPRCNSPHACPLISQCWSVLPECNVTELYRGTKKGFDLLDEGIFDITDVPDSRLSPQQLIQKNTLLTGKMHSERDRLRAWLNGLTYPVYHLDFETMNPAVPLFRGTRPYAQVPFQFSLHVQEGPGADPQHVEYLAVQPGDPRDGLIEALFAEDALGPEGTILAWNIGFEKMVLGDLAEFRPEYAKLLAGAADRMVDLLEPFRNFWVHHPGQRGSCSLKAVLPAVTDLSYDGLEVAEGADAAFTYERALYETDDPVERDMAFARLREYCALDTLGMVEILEKVRVLAD